jgi:hypothetical protein
MATYYTPPKGDKERNDLLQEIIAQLNVMNNLKLTYLYAAFGVEIIDGIMEEMLEGDEDE